MSQINAMKAEGTTLHVRLKPGADGYIVAECLEIPGCFSQGETEEEALSNIKDAIELCLSVMLEDSLKSVAARRHRPSKNDRVVRVGAPQITPVSALA